MTRAEEALDDFVMAKAGAGLPEASIRRLMLGVRAGMATSSRSEATLNDLSTKVAAVFPEAISAKAVELLATEVQAIEDARRAFDYFNDLARGRYPMSVTEFGVRSTICLLPVPDFSVEALKRVSPEPLADFRIALHDLSLCISESFDEFFNTEYDFTKTRQIPYLAEKYINESLKVASAQMRFGELVQEPSWTEREAAIQRNAYAITALVKANDDAARSRIMLKLAEPLWDEFIAVADEGLFASLGLDDTDAMQLASNYCDLVSGIRPQKSHLELSL